MAAICMAQCAWQHSRMCLRGACSASLSRTAPLHQLLKQLHGNCHRPGTERVIRLLLCVVYWLRLQHVSQPDHALEVESRGLACAHLYMGQGLRAVNKDELRASRDILGSIHATLTVLTGLQPKQAAFCAGWVEQLQPAYG